MIGKTISNYEIKSILGEGGMGTVYLAEHTKLGRKVAIKVLLPHLMKNEMVRERFINEAKMMATLHHPNIVTLYDYHEDENGLSLIMELVKGKPLDEYIQNVTGPIHEEDAVLLMTQALQGFAYAHKQGLIHRDIKPANLIVTDAKEIKILDFGIAKLVGDLGGKLTKTGSHIGTVYYMSPEQVRGRELDLRSDIYSLGITFYQMLTGFCPYEGLTTEFDVFNKIVGEELPDPKSIYPGVSDHMCRVIEKATAKNVEDRFQSCEEFIHALKNDDFVAVDKVKETPLEEAASTLVVGLNVSAEKEATSTQTTASKEPIVNKSQVESKSNLTEKKEEPKRENNLMIYSIIGVLAVVLVVILFVSMGGNSTENLGTDSEVESMEKNNENSHNSDVNTSSTNQSNSETNSKKETSGGASETKRTNKKTNKNSDGVQTPYENEETYEETYDPSAEIASMERANPSDYISISYQWNKTLLDDIKVDLKISNNASFVSYSNFEISISYYNKHGEYKGGTTKKVVTTLNPGYYVQNELKMTPPFGVKQIDVQLIRARAMN